MKKIATFFLFTVLSLFAKSQTNVSGGIYVNTTWPKANSPYIVTDSVAVFPGVTLTIEAGVTVKFENNKSLWLKPTAKLLAVGTLTDSITFTSNSPSPYPGIYGGISGTIGYGTRVSYCNFYYAQVGGGGDRVTHCKAMYNVDGLWANYLMDSCIAKYNTGFGAASANGYDSITNSIISNNKVGIHQGYTIINCEIDSNTEEGIKCGGGTPLVLNCKIRYDSVGIAGTPSKIDSCIITNNYFGIIPGGISTLITNCIINSNYIGILNGRYGFDYSNTVKNETLSFCEIKYNKIGIYHNPCAAGSCSGKTNNIISHNIIENDSIGIKLMYPDTVFCNSICNNSAYALQYLIGQNTTCAAHNNWCTVDSAATAAVIYDGYDNINYGLLNFMPIDSICSPLAAIQEHDRDGRISIYPNPAFDILNFSFPFSKIRIFNLLGEEKYNLSLSSDRKQIDISNLEEGIYIIEVATEKNVQRQKFIKQQNIQ